MQQQQMSMQAERSMSEPMMGDYEQQSMGASMNEDASGGYGGKQQPPSSGGYVKQGAMMMKQQSSGMGGGYGAQSGASGMGGGYGGAKQQKYEEPQVSFCLAEC